MKFFIVEPSSLPIHSPLLCPNIRLRIVFSNSLVEFKTIQILLIALLIYYPEYYENASINWYIFRWLNWQLKTNIQPVSTFATVYFYCFTLQHFATVDTKHFHINWCLTFWEFSKVFKRKEIFLTFRHILTIRIQITFKKLDIRFSQGLWPSKDTLRNV